MQSVLALAAALILALAVACGGGDGVPTATVVVSDDEGGRTALTVELARTPAEHSRGLSLREDLPEDRGMLFVFAEDSTAGFWMKDTSIPLSVAFLAQDGTILDIQEMEPFSTEVHRPGGPYRYALEVNRGWFQRHGFQSGDQVEVPDSVQAGE
jgi:uncharacterized membrane protein (UPF0127 family)